MPRFSKKPKVTTLTVNQHVTDDLVIVQAKLKLMRDWHDTACPECINHQAEKDADQLFELLTIQLPSITSDLVLLKLVEYLGDSGFVSADVRKAAKKLAAVYPKR